MNKILNAPEKHDGYHSLYFKETNWDMRVIEYWKQSFETIFLEGCLGQPRSPHFIQKAKKWSATFFNSSAFSHQTPAKYSFATKMTPHKLFCVKIIVKIQKNLFFGISYGTSESFLGRMRAFRGRMHKKDTFVPLHATFGFFLFLFFYVR